MNYTRKLRFMLYNIVRRWKSILACAFILALLFGVLSIIKEIKKIRNYNSNISTQQTAMAEIEEKIEVYTSEILNIDNEIVEFDKVVKNTDLVPISEALIYINIIGDGSNVEKKLDEIKYVYVAVMNNISLYNSIIKELDLNITPLTLTKLVTKAQNSSSIQISIKGFKKELNEKIIDIIIDELFATEKKLNATMKTHALDLISKTSTDVKSSIYSDVINELNTEKDNLLGSLENSQNKLNFYKLDLKNSQTFNIVSFITYILLGFIFGVALALIISSIIIIFDNKIYCIDDMEINFNIKPLGEILVAETKKTGKIDNLINKIFGYKQHVFSFKDPSSISRKIKESGTDKLLIIVDNKQFKDIASTHIRLESFSHLNAFTASENKEVVFRTIDEVNEKDFQAHSNIVLGIVYAKDKFRQVEREIEAITLLNKKIIGFVGISI